MTDHFGFAALQLNLTDVPRKMVTFLGTISIVVLIWRSDWNANEWFEKVMFAVAVNVIILGPSRFWESSNW
jgi:hypothetical protein